MLTDEPFSLEFAAKSSGYFGGLHNCRVVARFTRMALLRPQASVAE